MKIYIYGLLVYVRNILTATGIFLVMWLWATIRFDNTDTVESITHYGVIIFPLTLLLWLVCYYVDVNVEKLDHKIQLLEHQQLWVNYFISEFPKKDVPITVKQLASLNGAYWQLQSCQGIHPHDTSSSLKTLPIIQKATSIVNLYQCLVALFGTAHEDPLATSLLTQFLELKQALEESIEGVKNHTDAQDFVEQEAVLSNRVIRMEVDLWEYAHILHNDTRLRTLRFNQTLPALTPTADAFKTSKEFVAFLATLFSHEQAIQCKLIA